MIATSVLRLLKSLLICLKRIRNMILIFLCCTAYFGQCIATIITIILVLSVAYFFFDYFIVMIHIKKSKSYFHLKTI